MAFVTVDPDAIEAAEGQLRTLQGEIADHRQQHQWRADRTREGLDDLLRKSFGGLEPWAIQQFWDDLPLVRLANEYHTAMDIVRDIRHRMDSLFSTLAERHSGALHDRIRDLGQPALMVLDANSDALRELADLLTFGNMWNLIARPWTVEDLLTRVWTELGGADESIVTSRAALERLRQRALVLLDELQGSADTLGKGLVIGQEVPDLVKLLRGSKTLDELLKDTPRVGPAAIFSLLGGALGYMSDPDRLKHPGHALGANMIGSSLQFGISFIPVVDEVVALTDAGMAAVSLGSSIAAQSLNAIGDAQGGRWGDLTKRAGANYTKTAKDADAFDKTFTDVGAALLDAHAGTAVSMVASPALAPAVYHLENAAGSNYQNLPDDGLRVVHDVRSVLSVPSDIMRANLGTGIVGAGEAAHYATERWVPAGARQSVDNVIYSATSEALNFSNFVSGW